MFFSEFSGLPSFESVLKVLKQAKRDLGEVLASCELIDESTLHVCTENLKLKSPLPEYPFYMLIETHGSNNDHDQEKLNTFLEEVMASGLVLNGTVTNEPTKMKVYTYLIFPVAVKLFNLDCVAHLGVTGKDNRRVSVRRVRFQIRPVTSYRKLLFIGTCNERKT